MSAVTRSPGADPAPLGAPGADRRRPPRTPAASPPHAACVLDIRPHPLTDEGRGCGLVRLPEGGSVADLIAAALAVGRDELPVLAPAIEATLDGRRIAGDAWGTTGLAIPGETPTLTLRLAVRGGDDSDPLQTVLQVALIVAAAAVATTLGGVPGALASAAILVGGNLVLNSVFTPDLPPPPATPAVEPQYSLSGGANRARPWAPLPLVLGTHRLFPDLAAREYTEFRNGEQFLYQSFSFGVGDLDIGDRTLGDTPLDDYAGVRQQLRAPGADIDLVEGAVTTVAGGKLEHVPATGATTADWNRVWVQRRSAPDATRLAVDLVASLFGVSGRGDLQAASDQIWVQWRAAGSTGAWSDRRIDLRNASRTPLRRTVSIAVAKGQYDVRCRSNNLALGDDSRGVQDATWTALRSYRALGEDRGGDTRLAVEVRASGQLSGRLERLSAVVSQKVPVWTGTAWTADDAAGRRPSSNPAAVFRAFARGWRDAGGRLLAGSGRPAAEIDDAVLGRWHAWCETRGATCDLVVDGSAGPEEVEATIARRGQASPSWATGKLGAVWEDPAAPVAASITPARVLAGSVAVRWTSGEVAEEIVARYIDAEDGWKRSEYRALMPGVAEPAYTATVELTGATRRAQAVRECHLQAARQIYHRRRVSWAMGRDGATVSRGDVVYLSHDLVSGGVTGRLAGGTAAAPRLDRAVSIAAGSHFLFEAPDGTLHRSGFAGSAAAETDTPALADPLPADPSTRVEGAGPEDWTWRLYSAATPPLKMRIVEVSPRSAERFEIVAIDESAQYHAAADLPAGEPIPAPPAWQGPRILDAHVSETLLRVGAGWAVEIELVVTVAGDWRGGAVLAALDDGPSRRVARFDPGDDSASWIVPPTGTLDIAILPGSAVAPTGPVFRLRYEIGGALAAPGTPANFLIDVLPDGTRRFRWTPPPDIDLAGVEIRYAEDRVRAIPWDSMTPLHRGLLTSSPWETFEPSAGSWVIAMRAVDTGGRTSPDTRIVAVLPDQRAGSAALFRTPSAALGGRPAWTGTIVGVLSDDAAVALEAAADHTWADLATAGTTWATWDSWATGPGSGAAPHVRWTSEAIDIGATVTWSVAYDAPAASTTGTTALRFRGAASKTALAAATWHTLGAAGAPLTLTAQWVQVEVTAAAGTSAVSRLDHLSWWLPAPIVETKYLDIDTATWQGGVGNRLVPPGGLRLVTDILVALQSVGAGWSWDIAAKNPPRLRIWNAARQPRDATVDVVLRGLK